MWGWATRPNENWLVVVPFTDIYGLLTGVTNPSLKFDTVLMPGAVDPKFIVEKLSSEEITLFGEGPPATNRALLSVEQFENSKMHI